MILKKIFLFLYWVVDWIVFLIVNNLLYFVILFVLDNELVLICLVFIVIVKLVIVVFLDLFEWWEIIVV